MCGWHVKLFNTLVTHGPYLSALAVVLPHNKALYKSPDLLLLYQGEGTPWNGPSSWIGLNRPNITSSSSSFPSMCPMLNFKNSFRHFARPSCTYNLYKNSFLPRCLLGSYRAVFVRFSLGEVRVSTGYDWPSDYSWRGGCQIGKRRIQLYINILV